MASGGVAEVTLIDRLIKLDRTNTRRILIIGDRIVDTYVSGHLNDCQEGCPKFTEESRATVPGGAENAARTLSNWKAVVSMHTQPIGPVKTRFMVGGKCVFRLDDDRPGRTTQNFAAYRGDALRALLSESRPVGAVLLSDYDKGMLSSCGDFIQQVAQICKRKGIPCVADCKRAPEVYAGCILKCNSEYQHKHNDKRNWTEDGHSLVVTEGPVNPCVWDRGQLQKGFQFLPAVKCLNHVGAGDCFAAHLTLGLSYGLSLREAVTVAHSAGRVYVQHPHNRPPRLEEISADMRCV